VLLDDPGHTLAVAAAETRRIAESDHLAVRVALRGDPV